MELKELYKKLIKSEDFKEWKQKHPKDYLVHFFRFSEEFKGDWQIGYYNRETDKITCFVIGEQVGVLPEESVFKKEKAVKKLVLSKIKISEEEAFKKINEIKEKGYKGMDALRTLVIVQNIDIGQVWNITFITKEFKTLNFKIDSETGKVISHELSSLIQVDK